MTADNGAAVLVAAGASRRMGGGANKALFEAAGAALVVHAARALAAVVRHLVVVGRAEELDLLQGVFAAPGAPRVHAFVAGGEERVDSVRAGLAALPAGVERVLVHDAARPLVTSADVRRVYDAILEHGAALLAARATDTVKRARDGHTTEETLDRSALWLAQTPQGFEAPRFVELHERAAREKFKPTDDAALWERYEGPVVLVEASGVNLKVTRPEDLVVVSAILAARLPGTVRAMQLRVGTGFDVHRLAAGRPCVLGGVVLPHPTGPLGHSDGDAVLHALSDALLGAAGLDDLGTLFPDTEPRWKGADSGALLREVVRLVRAGGWRVENCDVVIATEGPRIAPHRAAMRASIAQLVGIDIGRVNVKGKSLEGLGALAGGAGVAVQAVCLLRSDV
jgi:2-C-methyl-D-erythritol 4-phosphate cytidylyltransferase/2-C-methyl-D-erythritol 2,4-cyclodiphosphate synthase